MRELKERGRKARWLRKELARGGGEARPLLRKTGKGQEC